MPEVAPAVLGQPVPVGTECVRAQQALDSYSSGSAGARGGSAVPVIKISFHSGSLGSWF